jgi:predicted nucleic acid-binding protein
VILVDSSVWIDHLHSSNHLLVDLLERDEVVAHPFVVQELALGSIRHRAPFLSSLGRLRSLPLLSNVEVLELVERRKLWGRGLSAIDTHLVGSAMVTPGARLWTRDRRLRTAAARLGVAFAA